jgi:DNA-binding NarL/FixJ family response regulator
MNPKKIIIIEDEALIAIEIESTLEMLGFQVVGHSMNGDEALDLFNSTPADLVLLDINIKGSLNGIDLAKILKEKYNTPFVFLTSHTDPLTLGNAKKVMPYGYIVKPFNENDLKVNIELALYKYESEIKTNSFSKSTLEKKHKVELTDREYSILLAFYEGKSYKEAANQLNISINTIKTYQKRLFFTFDVSTRYELLSLLNSK